MPYSCDRLLQSRKKVSTKKEGLLHNISKKESCHQKMAAFLLSGVGKIRERFTGISKINGQAVIVWKKE